MKNNNSFYNQTKTNMNTETLDKMKKMRLHGMHRTYQTLTETNRAESLTNDEFTGQLVQNEWDDRLNRAITRSTQRARFRYKSEMEEIDFVNGRGLDKNQLHRLAEGTFIRKYETLLITGSTGTGKSFIASALGHHACQLGFKVLYANTSKLLAQLKLAKADGSALKELSKIERMDLLILDDFGLQPFDAQSRTLLMEIFEDRHGKRATIVTSQLPVKMWYEIIGEKTVADAILDRIAHDAHRIELKGESLRKQKKTQAEN